MDILSQIASNIIKRAHTRRPEAVVPYPDGFRGELLHDPSLCTACGTCAYFCSPSAIAIDRIEPQTAAWKYQPLKCTFCGRCVEYCPTHALSFDRRLMQPLLETQRVEHAVEGARCERCGEPIFPLPRPVLEEKYGTPIPAEIEQSNRYCERCRMKASGAAIKRGFLGGAARLEDKE